MPALAMAETAAEAYESIRATTGVEWRNDHNNELWIAVHALSMWPGVSQQQQKGAPSSASAQVQKWAL